MNVTAHQEKEKNEETRMGKRKVGEGRGQATDFEEAVSCSSAVVQGGSMAKRMVCARGVLGITGIFRKATTISIQLKRGRGPHHLFEAAVDWCRVVLPRPACCVLSRLCCNGRSPLLNSYLSGISAMDNFGPASSVIRSRPSLVSLCTVQLRTLFATRSLATPLFTTSGLSFWKFSGFWGSMVCRRNPIPRKGSSINSMCDVALIFKRNSRELMDVLGFVEILNIEFVVMIRAFSEEK